MAFPCLDQLAVSVVLNLAVSVDVISEVSGRDVTLITCDAVGVILIDVPVTIHITREEAKRNIAVRLSIVVNVLRM